MRSVVSAARKRKDVVVAANVTLSLHWQQKNRSLQEISLQNHGWHDAAAEAFIKTLTHIGKFHKLVLLSIEKNNFSSANKKRLKNVKLGNKFLSHLAVIC